MNTPYNNRLINGYQNFNQNNIPYQNNMLLQNNPMFVNNIQQMQMLQMQQMQKIKEMQQIRQIEKINEIETKMDKEKIKESIIRPIKIEKSKDEKRKLEHKWKDAEKNYLDNSGKEYGPEIKQYWKNRTNQPYKNILKNENYSKNFKSKDDLIVHKVTNKDKEGVEEGYVNLQNKIETHDKELKVIYSTNNKNEHKKKFDYNHVYKYRVQYDPKSHDKLKDDKIKYYKELQKKEEEGKQKMDAILETLVSDGIFDKDEINSININKSNNDSDKELNQNSTPPESPQRKDKRDIYLSRQKK
jgi:hypothetical protein